MFSVMHSIHNDGCYHSAFFNSMCELWNRMVLLRRTYQSQYLPSILYGKETEAKRQAINPVLCKEWRLIPGMAAPA